MQILLPALGTNRDSALAEFDCCTLNHKYAQRLGLNNYGDGAEYLSFISTLALYTPFGALCYSVGSLFS